MPVSAISRILSAFCEDSLPPGARPLPNAHESGGPCSFATFWTTMSAAAGQMPEWVGSLRSSLPENQVRSHHPAPGSLLLNQPRAGEMRCEHLDVHGGECVDHLLPRVGSADRNDRGPGPGSCGMKRPGALRNVDQPRHLR